MHPHLLFAFLFLTASICQGEDNDQYPSCPPSKFNCGSIQNITYPFSIKGSPGNCSYPGFELTCNNNSPLIEIESKEYGVKNINYETQILTIVDTDLKGKQCPPISSDSSLNFSLFDYTANDFNLTIYNCPEPPQNTTTLHQLPCLTNGVNHSYYVIQKGSPVDMFGGDGYAYGSPCVMSVFSFLGTYVGRLRPDLTNFGDVMEEGFEVRWVVDSGRCGNCVVSGGSCGYNPDEPYQPLCYCRDMANPVSLTCPSPPPPSNASRGKTMKIITGLSGFFLACFFAVVFFLRKFPKRIYGKILKRTFGNSKVEEFLQSYGSLAPKRYRYAELKKMTNSFKEKLGQGGYGGVFKGKLNDGRLVAVKVLNKSKGNGGEFINEVASIGRTYHVNVVTLLGFCSEGSKRALLYEFMSNGSLEKFIYSDKSGETRRVFECERLFQIAVGIARGLEYLHRGCSTRILHFDIKPHNILLDDNFCPKISDFGLAKLCPEHESIVSMQDARGTVGYIAPEVFCRNIGRASHKSDVYSYGMMVLEMVGGRKNIDARVENISEIYFPHWVYSRPNLQESLGSLGIMTDEDKEIAMKMILVGLWCIQTDPTNRPSMSKVVEMLEGSLEALQMPPKPYLSSP